MNFLTARKIIAKCIPVAVLCANVCVMSPVELKGESSHKKTKQNIKKICVGWVPSCCGLSSKPWRNVKGAHALQSHRSLQTHWAIVKRGVAKREKILPNNTIKVQNKYWRWDLSVRGTWFLICLHVRKQNIWHYFSVTVFFNFFYPINILLEACLCSGDDDCPRQGPM